MRLARAWRLRSHLCALLVVATLLPFGLVGGALLAYRVPQIERETQDRLHAEVAEIEERVTLMLSTKRVRLEQLAALLGEATPAQRTRILDNVVARTQLAEAVYLLSPQGQVQAVGLPEARRAERQRVLGRDLSPLAAYRAVSSGRASAWSGAYVSQVTGVWSVAVAVRADAQGVLLAEVPLEVVNALVRLAADHRASFVWLAERNGAVVSTAGAERAQAWAPRDLAAVPLAALTQDARTQTLRLQGHRVYAAMAPALALEWVVLGLAPSGLDHPDVRSAIWLMGGAMLGCLAVGLLMALFWASRLAKPLKQIVQRAARTEAPGQTGQAWPRGTVVEFNALSSDLQTMSVALAAREHRLQAIFNASPVPLSVVSADRELVLRDVNDAWCRALQRTREQAIGRSVMALGLWRAREMLDKGLAEMQDGRTSTDTWMVRGDGQEILMQAFGGKTTELTNERVVVWALVEIGPLRRVEHELQQFNQQLESRVAQRTQALAQAHDALSQTVAQLRAAQDELVRTEKVAALGKLVASVAHEVNTPLGNGVMAVSALADGTRSFKRTMQSGLKRADLQQYVSSVVQGTDIAGRNLRRAAELVQSFKQVAVDQTSAQRRSFELSEVVHEIVVSLRPSFSRTPYRIEVEVPEHGLRLDSYPGALGQALANLIQNAVAHGFDGRAHGTVRITGVHDAADDRLVLRVADDGLGIPADMLAHVFEPFVTSKVDRGGTGLGLHITHNAIVDLIGGSLTVSSTEGVGTVFEMRLPRRSPRT